MTTETDLIASVDTLTTKTNELLDTYVAAKVAVEDAVVAVEADKNEVATNTTTVASALSGAQSAAAAAQTYKEQALQISGLDTVDDAVTLALSDGGAYARTLADMEAERAQNKERFAASGFVHHGNTYYWGSEFAVNEGITVSGSLTTGRDENAVFMGTLGSSVKGNSKTDWPELNLAGMVTQLKFINSIDSNLLNRCILPPAPDGRTTYNSSTGETITHADAAAAFAYADVTANVEVVINRVDMFGFEGYFEEITAENPYVYPHGLIQSQATTMEGITTSRSNRPATYYAVYDGDTSSAGKGLNFFALSVENRKKILSNPKHHIYYIPESGKWIQWRIRQRSIAGAGNGDWANIDSIGQTSYPNYILTSKSDVSTRVSIQGADDTPKASGDPFYVSTASETYNSKPQKGVFSVSTTGGGANAYNGECYFYVMGTVPRLNQGAYHPDFNPLGTRSFGSSGDGAGRYYWYSTAYSITSTKQCFDAYLSTTTATDGAIGDNAPKRPDGKFYDAIYASGLGGVIDHRLKYGAWDASSAEQAAVVREEVKNGTYRGREKLHRVTSFLADATPSGATSWLKMPYSEVQGVTAGYANNAELIDEYGYMVDSDGNSYKVVSVYDTGTELWLKGAGSPTLPEGKTWNAGFGKPLNITVEGEFTQTDVIGDPAEILVTPQLANGWLGSWIPVIPDGSAVQYFTMGKNNLDAISAQYTADSGVSWSSFVVGDASNTNNNIDSITNELRAAPAIDAVLIVHYTAFAKQTKPSSNKPVLHGEKGISAVYVTANWSEDQGALLGESVLGVIGKASAGVRINTLALQSISLNPIDRVLGNPAFSVDAHEALSLNAPQNDSDAIKVLFHQIEDNGQAGLNIIANELKHNGSSWGDDATMKLIENGTYTNLNGITCKAVIHELAKPYGWIKNDV